MRISVIGMLILTQAMAAKIAIIDSGTDINHKDFTTKVWMNAVDSTENGVDEDGNLYPDDIYGWNFAEDNNKVIDMKYLGTFSDTPRKFFDIQKRQLLGELTEADKKWLEEVRSDRKKMQELQTFGNFIHGTHVAGITQKKNDKASILSVKMIPTKITPFIVNPKSHKDVRERALKTAISALASQSAALIDKIADYVHFHQASVANGSFGTDYKRMEGIISGLFRLAFFRKPKPEEAKKFTMFFFEETIRLNKASLAKAPNTLFVFAAGNSASNNDELPTTPTNVKTDNSISVAATYQDKILAPFSNYGKEMVDIAAPGMLINSQIPGDEYLVVSGTSQAAPYIANVAAMIKDENPELSPKKIKEIMMKTADKKSFLTNKVKSGLVNRTRAVEAAKMTKSLGLKLAIARSWMAVPRTDKKYSKLELTLLEERAHGVQPLPLLPLFVEESVQ